VLELTGWFHDSAPAKQLKQTTLVTGRFAVHLAWHTRVPTSACCCRAGEFGGCSAAQHDSRMSHRMQAGEAAQNCRCQRQGDRRLRMRREGPLTDHEAAWSVHLCHLQGHVSLRLHYSFMPMPLRHLDCRPQPWARILLVRQVEHYRSGPDC
jgi:hypothetical protein